MMPLLYIEDDETKEKITGQALKVLDAYSKGNPKAPRMKGLDVVKILMGIMSQRDSVKQFQWDGKFWASLNEYDYE